MDPAVRSARVERRAVLDQLTPAAAASVGAPPRRRRARPGAAPSASDQTLTVPSLLAVATRSPVGAITNSQTSFVPCAAIGEPASACVGRSHMNTRPSPVPASSRCPSRVKATLRKSTPARERIPDSVSTVRVVELDDAVLGGGRQTRAVGRERDRPQRSRRPVDDLALRRSDSRSQRHTPRAPTATSQRPLGSIAASSMPPSGPTGWRSARPVAASQSRTVPSRAPVTIVDPSGVDEHGQHVADRYRLGPRDDGLSESATRAFAIACCASAVIGSTRAALSAASSSASSRLRRRERRGLRAERATEAILGFGLLVLRMTQREERHRRSPPAPRSRAARAR